MLAKINVSQILGNMSWKMIYKGAFSLLAKCHAKGSKKVLIYWCDFIKNKSVYFENGTFKALKWVFLLKLCFDLCSKIARKSICKTIHERR